MVLNKIFISLVDLGWGGGGGGGGGLWGLKSPTFVLKGVKVSSAFLLMS